MTSPTQTVRGAETGRGVKTNGVGKVTTAHLNLTVDMAGQVAAEVEERRHVTNSHEQRSKSHG